MSEYRLRIIEDDGQIRKLNFTVGALLYVGIRGNWQEIPFGDWQTMEKELRRLTAEEFWEGLRHVVADLDQRLDQLGLSPDILDFYHSRGITRVTEIPWEPLREGLITYLHNIWIVGTITPKEQQFISILAAMAQQVLQQNEAVKEEPDAE